MEGTCTLEGRSKKRFQVVVESGKAILGQGTGLSKATEAGKQGAQVGDSESGGSTRHFRAEGSGQSFRRH